MTKEYEEYHKRMESLSESMVRSNEQKAISIMNDPDERQKKVLEWLKKEMRIKP